MHTLPSIDEVATYMSFEGIRGSCAGPLGRLDALAGEASGRKFGWAWGCCGGGGRSDRSFDKGGGYGDVDMLVTDAECAW